MSRLFKLQLSVGSSLTTREKTSRNEHDLAHRATTVRTSFSHIYLN